MKAIARSLVVIFVALIAVPVVAFTQTVSTAVALLATTVLMMGGTGTPLADPNAPETQSYMSTMLNGLYADDLLYDRVAVYTPEEFWPSTGNDDLIFDESVAKGVDSLDGEIRQADTGNNKIIVFGYSQSAVIIAKEKQRLANDPGMLSDNVLEFVVVGSLSNPDGGLFTRLPGFVIPGLGVTFEPAMPNDDYLTTSYVREYEGLADLPDNPLNLLAMGNALVGAALLHPDYRSVDPNDTTNNITLPSSDPDSVYILIPTPRLPILMVFDGVAPEPILAGLDPVLRWGVDLGYDRTTPANEPTPFTLLPTFDPITAASELPTAIADGIDAAASASNLPVALPLQPIQAKAPTGNQAPNDVVASQAATVDEDATDIDKPSVTTRPRPLQVIRDSLEFTPKKLRSAIASGGVGPLRRIVGLITGQRPEPAPGAQPADQLQDDAA